MIHLSRPQTRQTPPHIFPFPSIESLESRNDKGMIKEGGMETREMGRCVEEPAREERRALGLISSCHGVRW